MVRSPPQQRRRRLRRQWQNPRPANGGSGRSCSTAANAPAAGRIRSGPTSHIRDSPKTCMAMGAAAANNPAGNPGENQTHGCVGVYHVAEAARVALATFATNRTRITEHDWVQDSNFSTIEPLAPCTLSLLRESRFHLVYAGRSGYSPVQLASASAEVSVEA
jgi:hypothetical protein